MVGAGVLASVLKLRGTYPKESGGWLSSCLKKKERKKIGLVKTSRSLTF